MSTEITLVRTKQNSFKIHGGKETTAELLAMAKVQGQRGLKKAGLDPDSTPPFYRPGAEKGYAIIRCSWGRKKLDLVWGDHYMVHLGDREGREHQEGRTREHFLDMLEQTSPGDELTLKVREVEYIPPSVTEPAL